MYKISKSGNIILGSWYPKISFIDLGQNICIYYVCIYICNEMCAYILYDYI